jgi:hypothetical protein
MLDHALRFFQITPDFDLDVVRPTQILHSGPLLPISGEAARPSYRKYHFGHACFTSSLICLWTYSS